MPWIIAWYDSNIFNSGIFFVSQSRFVESLLRQFNKLYKPIIMANKALLSVKH